MGMDFDGGLTCSLGVSDLDRSIAWYSRHLGCKLLYKAEEIGWCELQTAVARVNIGLSENDEPGGKGGATLTFGVSDIDAAAAELIATDVRHDGPIQDIPGLVRLFTFYDPDDNALMLYQEARDA